MLMAVGNSNAMWEARVDSVAAPILNASTTLCNNNRSNKVVPFALLNNSSSKILLYSKMAVLLNVLTINVNITPLVTIIRTTIML